MSEEKCLSRVTPTSIRAPTESQSRVCLRELQIILNKDIVHKYLIDKSSSSKSASKKNMKQMTHYSKNNKALDTCTSNQPETVFEKIPFPLTGKSTDSFLPKEPQIQTSINNGNKFNCAVKTEPNEILNKSTDEVYMNDSRAFIDNDELDIGEEFKYSDFLRSINAQVDVLNEQTTQKPKSKVKPTLTGRSLAEKRPHKKIKTLQCDHCGLEATHKRFLRNHMKSKHSQLHDESGFITCVKCNKKYTTFDRFQFHERICGTKFYYPCKFCQKKMVDRSMKSHLIKQHAKDFDVKKLNEILQWSKSKRIRETARSQNRIETYKKFFFNNSESKKWVKIFCSKCDIYLEIEKREPMDQCFKCKSALMLQCHKCEKVYSNVVSAMTHVRQRCEYEENKVTIEKNKEVLEVFEDQQTNNNLESPQKERMEQHEISSTDKMILNENRDIDEDLDIGEEFKYIEFLSNSENAQVNLVNKTAIVQEIDDKKKRKVKKPAQQQMIKSYACDYCGHRTKQKVDIESHIENKHSEPHDENGFYTCARCDKKYRMLASFHNHKRICGMKLYFPCKFCSKVLTPDALKKHVFRQHGKEFVAKKINEILQWSKSKAVRIASNSENIYTLPMPKESPPYKKKIKYFYCNDCDYQTYAKRRLFHHIRFQHVEDHNKKGLIICPKCERSFKFSRLCKAHQLVCSATFDYKCKFCKYTSKVSSRVRKHIKSIHADKVKGKNFTHIFNEILKERNSTKENYKAAKLKKILIDNTDLTDCFDLYKVIKMICPKCHDVSARMKYQSVKYCSKCEKLLEYQCQRCGQCYDKYYSALKHARFHCQLIKKK